MKIADVADFFRAATGIVVALVAPRYSIKLAMRGMNEWSQPARITPELRVALVSRWFGDVQLSMWSWSVIDTFCHLKDFPK